MSFLYEIRCSTCGSDLEMTGADLDSSIDLTIRVAPCSDCIDDALRDAEKKEE